MRSGNVSVLGAVASVAMGVGLSAYGQTASFTGVGTLGGATSRCNAVSSEGSVVAGVSLDGNGNLQAFIWTSGNGMKGLGFLDPTYQESDGRGVDVESGGIVHVAGTSLNSNNKDQGFHWYGDILVPGTGTMVGIPFLPGGNESCARALRVKAGTDEVYITGTSNKDFSGSLKKRAYRWRTGAPGASLDLGDLPGGSNRSEGYDLGWDTGGNNIIVGWSRSTWWVGDSANEAFRWNSSGSSILGRKGLDHVCGRGFQIAAGPDGEADTPAHASDIQVEPVGTTGLDPEDIIVSSGADRWLQTEHAGAGRVDDDLLRPEGHSPQVGDGYKSQFVAISRNARFSVGKSTYPPLPSEGWTDPYRPYQANLRDVRIKDGEPDVDDHCGGNVMHFGLGFLPGDNYSYALDVSNTADYYSREGLAVVGYSRSYDTQTGEYLNEPRAVVWFINESYDVFGFDLEMHDLKTYLEGQGLDLSEWELREATGVSDDGAIVAGYGLHNGVEEGWVAALIGGPVGACCLPDGSCVENLGWECNDMNGQWQGGGTTCDQVICCVHPFADADGDGDVDQGDFGVFQACLTGEGGSASGYCTCFDRRDQNNQHGQDGDVDQDDYGAFENCATGPGISADPSCDDPPT